MKKLKYEILFTILVMTIGVAAVTTNIILSGSTSIASNPDDFDVYFSNVRGSNERVTVYAQSERELKFNVDLKSSSEDGMAEFEVVNASSNYDASVSLNCNSSSQYISLGYYLVDEIIPARNSTNGFVNVTLFKSYSGDDELKVDISCSISATAVERTTISNGEVSSPVYYVGKEIAIGDEKFNVITDNGDTVSMLAQKSLDSNYKQSDNPSFARFANSNGWEYAPGPKDIVIKEHDGEVKTYIENYELYLKNISGDLFVRGDLISVRQLIDLGCYASYDYTHSGSETCVDSYYFNWLINGNRWWTKSAFPDPEGEYYGLGNKIWYVEVSGVIDFEVYNPPGITVRPVITISKEALEKKIISFYIGDEKYYAYEGMTWGEWVDSSFNTSGYISSGGLIDKNMMCSFVAEPGYGCVVTSRAIIDSFSYVGNECAGGSE